MKNWLLLLLVSLGLACGTSTEESTDGTSSATETPKEAPPEKPAEETASASEENPIAKITGYYVGMFRIDDDLRDNLREKGNYTFTYANKINISIEALGDDKIYGRSVVAGNDRPFTGTYTSDGKTLQATVKEPGDDRYDGQFTFTIDLEAGQMTGTWEAYDKQVTVYKRTYRLEKEAFTYEASRGLPDEVGWADLYNANEYGSDEGEFLTEQVLAVNASSQRLTAAQVENMYRGDLEILRNSIYARHGYSFKNRKVRYVFDRHVDWYIPVSTDVRDQLTNVELANIDLLKRYEQHADRYYDSFGR